MDDLLRAGAGVQVLLLRDGLLAGSHALLPGTFSVGSSEWADVMLDDPAVAPEHAQLHFNGRLAEIDATGGAVYVNGHPVRRCAVRPADDVMCGPFVLKVRVLRAAPPKLTRAPVPVVTLPSARTKALRDAEPTTRVELPSTSPSTGASPRTLRAVEALFVESRWGDQRCHSACLRAGRGALIAAPSDDSAFPLWGFGSTGPFLLADASGGTFRVFIPKGATAEVAGRRVELGTSSVEVRGGEVVRLRAGGVDVIARRGSLPEQARGGRPSGAPIGLALAAALVVILGRSVPAPEPGPDFERHPDLGPRLRLLIDPPRPPEPPRGGPHPTQPPSAPPSGSAPRLRKRPPSTGGIEAVRRILQGGSAVANISHARMGRGGAMSPGRGFKVADLVAAGPIGDGVLSGFTRGNGIQGGELLHGAGGLGIGALGAGGIGHGAVGGRVTGAGAHPHATGGGQIDTKGVLEVVNAHLSQIQACYETALLHRPDISGTAKLEWVVSTSGDVTSARTLTSTLPDAAVESCILRHLKTWRFPRARTMPVTISYPFIFHPVAG
jgi:hypothetical protein